MKKDYSLKSACIFSTFLCLVAYFVLQNHYTLLTQGTLESARIVGCDSKRFSNAGQVRKNRTQYTPIAVSDNQNKAIGSIWYDKDLCEGIINTNVDIYVHPTDSSKNRIASFTHFWLFPSLFGMLILLTLMVAILPKLVGLACVACIGFGAYHAINEYRLFGFGYDSNVQNQESAGKDISVLSLNQCVRESMDKKNLQTRTEVKYLLCQDAGIEDLSSIADLVNLEEMYLQGNNLKSLESMPAFNKLKRLSVAGMKNLVSLKGVERLPALEELQANKSGVEDLSGVETLKNLRVVGLMQNNINDVSAFSDLSEIEDITISRNHVSDISAFANKPKLIDFQAYGNMISDISPLFGNTSMKIVGVRGKGNVPCAQIDRLRSLIPNARIYGQKECDE